VTVRPTTARERREVVRSTVSSRLQRNRASTVSPRFRSMLGTVTHLGPVEHHAGEVLLDHQLLQRLLGVHPLPRGVEGEELEGDPDGVHLGRGEAGARTTWLVVLYTGARDREGRPLGEKRKSPRSTW
jgi:hypothetical protein